jgi:pSer/pThr/pTyr-binding forkhead associated (FHA) protein
MLCPTCHRHVAKGDAACSHCGRRLSGSGGPFELVLPDRTRVPVMGPMTIGRAPGNTLQLADQTVSRHHARISLNGGLGDPLVDDTGSSHGTWVNDRRIDGPVALSDGARLRLGDQELLVERRRSQQEAGRTIVVPRDASLVLSTSGDPAELEPAATRFGTCPRLHSGYALKRLEAAEGSRRWVLKNLTSERMVRLSDADARLLELIDGRRSLSDLVREAEILSGDEGPALLARLLAELGDRGFLAGVNGNAPEAEPPSGLRQRLLTPRSTTWAGAGEFFDRLYRRGAWLLFTRPALASLAVLASVGLAVFGFLVAARYGTPFVVASKVGLGGLVFVLGRFALVAAHETAHGITMSSFGRPVRKAGLKMVLLFPYAFVDTSEAWFEPRRRRIAVSAAGPVSDFALGGLFSLLCLALPAGILRDIFFQLAFAADVGGLFNLNPLLERDGYNILVDVLREPGLRRRAREQFKGRLSGGGRSSDSPVLARYSLFAVAWSFVAAGFAVVMSLRYQATLTALVPSTVAWSMLVALWLALFTPALTMVLLPLRERVRAWET